MRAATGFHPSDVWFGQQAVYRVSLGTALFFLGMAVLLKGVRYKGDRRGRALQHGGWGAKVGAWALLVALTFLLPNGPIAAYGWIARLGSGLFLIVQVIILLDFAQSWNDAWAQKGEEDPRWLYGLLALTALALAGCALVAAAALHFFNPSVDAEGLPLGHSCGLNVFLIVMSLLAALGMCALSVAPVARRGSLFPAAAMALYCCYLVFSALQSEPPTYSCNALARRVDAASGSTVAVGVLVTLSSVVYSALRAGSNTNLFLLDEEEDEEEEVGGEGGDGPAGGAYVPLSRGPARGGGVLTAGEIAGGRMVGGGGGGDGRVGIGWASVGVKAFAAAAAALLYCWTLVAPALFPDREFY
jgi:hypothetical protein